MTLVDANATAHRGQGATEDAARDDDAGRAIPTVEVDVAGARVDIPQE